MFNFKTFLASQGRAGLGVGGIHLAASQTLCYFYSRTKTTPSCFSFQVFSCEALATLFRLM